MYLKWAKLILSRCRRCRKQHSFICEKGMAVAIHLKHEEVLVYNSLPIYKIYNYNCTPLAIDLRVHVGLRVVSPLSAYCAAELSDARRRAAV